MPETLPHPAEIARSGMARLSRRSLHVSLVAPLAPMVGSRGRRSARPGDRPPPCADCKRANDRAEMIHTNRGDTTHGKSHR